MCNVAPSDFTAYKGIDYITAVIVAFGNVAGRSDKIVQGKCLHAPAKLLNANPYLNLFRCFSRSASQSCQLFMSVAVNQPGIDYHVVLAQNALQQCLDMIELQAELICILVKQTSRHTSQKLGAGVQVNKKLGKQTRVSSMGRLNWLLIHPLHFSISLFQLNSVF